MKLAALIKYSAGEKLCDKSPPGGNTIPILWKLIATNCVAMIDSSNFLSPHLLQVILAFCKMLLFIH